MKNNNINGTRIAATAVLAVIATLLYTVQGDYCYINEFRDCEKCSGIDFRVEFFYGCGVSISGSTVRMYNDKQNNTQQRAHM